MQFYFLKLQFFLICFAYFSFAELDSNKKTLACKNHEATKLLIDGFNFQSVNQTEDALRTYQKTLERDPTCSDAHYEIGWSYWKMGEWESVLSHWKMALKIDPKHSEIPKYIHTVEENLKIVKSGAKTTNFRKKVALLSQSLPLDSPIRLTLIQRWQSNDSNSNDQMDKYDTDIFSPKSVTISDIKNLAAVNSLEGKKTIFFSIDGKDKKSVFRHSFSKKEVTEHSLLNKFNNYPIDKKMTAGFEAKPVESIFTHQGKYLWITHYRKTYDEKGQKTSTVAVLDVDEGKLVKLFNTGPISKYIESSKDNNWIAVSNWGDNTISIFDISGSDPSKFKFHQLLTVEKKLELKNLGTNRDKDCGFCIRGLAFSHDSRFLYVTRMKGGGLTLYKKDNDNHFKLFGHLKDILPGPRDIHFSPDGDYVFVGCNATGNLIKFKHLDAIKYFEDKNNPEFKVEKVFIGLGLRSFKIHPKLDYLFMTSNNGSEIVIVRQSNLDIIGRVPVDSFPVGLSVSDDGRYLWITSQGKESVGGNSVSVFLITEYLNNLIKGQPPVLNIDKKQ